MESDTFSEEKQSYHDTLTLSTESPQRSGETDNDIRDIYKEGYNMNIGRFSFICSLWRKSSSVPLRDRSLDVKSPSLTYVETGDFFINLKLNWFFNSRTEQRTTQFL